MSAGVTQPAPYPADTRAKGWRFELDLERIRQSDTWALAPADVRPWLFLLWATAWEQVPCGSLPADEKLIAARIEMAPKAFSKAREVLMRGWWAADDGRLYHDTISSLVVAMLHTKERDKARKAEYRARMDAERARLQSAIPPTSTSVPWDNDGTPKDSASLDDTGTGTGTGTSTKIKTEAIASVPAKSPRASRKCPESFEVTDDLRQWASAKVPGIDIEAETAKFLDWTFATARSDWPATWRNWMRKSFEGIAKPAQALSFRERDAQLAAARVHEITGGLVSAKPATRRTDALQEVFDVTPRLVG